MNSRSIGSRAGWCFLILFSTIFLASCSSRRVVLPLPGAGPAGAKVPETTFGRELARHLSLPEASQEDRRAQAEAGLKAVRQFQKEAHQSQDAKLRQWYYLHTQLDRSTYGMGAINSIVDLKAAVDLDPSFAEAWQLLGHLCAVVGDLPKAREHLDHARLAAMARSQQGRPLAAADQLAIFRDRAWALRDLGLWNEGLEAVDEGLRYCPGDPDLVLIKGLLLAGAGRTAEALSLAVRMPPLTYPKFDVFHFSNQQQTSDFANRWIKSQAFLAAGDYEMARHVLGEMTSYPYRWFLPHQKRYFNDVGLVSELVGEEDAGTYYALALISDPYYGFYPWSAGNLEPLVLDVPQARAPYFTCFGNRFYLAGSPLSFAASQMNTMSLSTFPRQRSQAAWRAKQALDIAERRNIRPDVVRALRGRVYFGQEELVPARADLTAACDAFRAKGTIDAGTSLLLGLLDMSEGRHDQAVPLLEEAVAVDPGLAVGWRSLGVSLVHLGRRAEAEAAMDRALALEPRSVSGLYNRGLLHLQNQEFARAGADLQRAFQLDPENHEVQRLLQMAAAGHRAQGGDPGEIGMMAEQDERDPAAAADLDPEALLASLERDIQTFFAVPDSLRERMGSADETVTALRARWLETGDPMVRRVLALAYLDRGLIQEVQDLLGPGWGVDLSPEEEVMLLYADRLEGEQERAHKLAQALLKGEQGLGNPYLLRLLPEEDRKHWSEVLTSHYMEGYSARTMENADATRFAFLMRQGFQNVRMAKIQPDGTIIAPILPSWYRHLAPAGGVTSAVSGGRPTSGRRAGNVVK